jgi:hypothetical protein
MKLLLIRHFLKEEKNVSGDMPVLGGLHISVMSNSVRHGYKYTLGIRVYTRVYTYPLIFVEYPVYPGIYSDTRQE